MKIGVHENGTRYSGRFDASQNQLKSHVRQMPNGNLEFDTLFITFPVDIKESFEF